MGAQYVGDVFKNIISGETGANIFKRRSSLGEYFAAGVTALIPGSGFAGALVKNVVTEGIVSIENRIKGQPNNFLKSALKIFAGSVLDVGAEKISNSVLKCITAKLPRNYSTYAGQQYKMNPGITRQQIEQNLIRTTRWRTGIAKSFGFVVDSIRNAFS